MAWAGAVHAAEYWLCAKSASVIMPGSVSVPMWGYALDCTGFDGNCAAPASVPGPELSVPVGEGLTVHLRNVDLPEPTSLVIPGQPSTMTPVRHTAGQYAGRVRSFAAEATAGTDQTYSWATVPGLCDQPFRFGRLCREAGILFAIDASQSAGKLPIDMEEQFLDAIAFTGH